MENKDPGPSSGKCEMPSPFSLWETWEEVSVELKATKDKDKRCRSAAEMRSKMLGGTESYERGR